MSERAPRLPERPSVPFAFLGLLAALGGQRLALALPEFPAAPVMAGVAVAGAVVPLVCRHVVGRVVPPARVAAAALACLALGILTGGLLVRQMGACVEGLGSRPVSSYAFEVAADPSEGRYGERERARVLEGGRWVGQVWLTGEGLPARGHVVSGVGRFSALGEGEWAATSRRQGVCGTVRMVRVLTDEPPSGPVGLALALRERVVASLLADGSDEGAFLAGCVCGYSVPLRERGLDALFAACGLSHLVTVSGTHVSLVATLVGALLLRLGPAWRGAGVAVASGALVLTCGIPASGVRAWLMSLAALLGQLRGRRGHAASSVCVVALAMALADPTLQGQLGFLLSVGCVVGLSLFARYASYALEVLAPLRLPGWVPARARRTLASSVGSLRDGAAASFVAGVASAPLALPAFGTLSLVGPVANALVGPLFLPLLALGVLAGALAWAPVAQAPVLAVARLLAGASLALMRALSRLPLASLPVSVGALPAALVAWGGGLALLLSWPRLERRWLARPLGFACCLVAGLLVSWRLLAPARVVVLDVGQGDAILVQDGASAVLVDTGPDGAVAARLAEEHVLHLDAVVLTHLHGDHAGGLPSLVGVVPCERVLVGEGVGGAMTDALSGTVGSLTGCGVDELHCGDVLSVGRFELVVLSPEGPTDGDENEDSLVLSLSFDDGGRTLTGLLTGDAEGDVLAALAGEGRLPDVDLLKVGHHGSAASVAPEEAALLSPAVAVASAGAGNPYGHPTQECAETLTGAGAVFLCTIDAGSVTIAPAEGGVLVRTRGP